MIFLYAVETSLGRIEKNSLSQETLMELLVEGITENKHKICADINEMTDEFPWINVKLNDSNDITDIFWTAMSLKGSIELQWLPITAKVAYFSFNKMTGTIDLTCLPDSLEELSLGSNYFHGTVDLTSLPSGLRRIHLYSNEFSGSTDFSHLPKSLKDLNVRDTRLEGEIREFDGEISIDFSRIKDRRKK